MPIDRRRKLPDIQEENVPYQEELPSLEVVPESQYLMPVELEPKVYYKRLPWKADLYTFMCTQCTHCEMVEDNIILHVVSHAPEAERNQLLDTLIKNKES